MPARYFFSVVVAGLLFAGCDGRLETEAHPAASSREVTAADSDAPDDGQWTMPGRNYASTRFSGLTQITNRNVGRLGVAWTFATGTDRGQEAAPVVVGSTMFVVTSFPNIVYALDLARAGAVRWKYEPHPDPSAQGVACCDVVNRGATVADGRVFFNTLDNHTIALDAGTGREIWKTRLADINTGETMTMAPMVVKGKVIVGNSGGEFGVRGRVTALDARSGRILWTAYSTGPDRDVLIGARFKPFYQSDRGKDLGVTSWPPEHWKIGGGTVWGWMSYDPELDLLYHGTANPGPWNHEMRPGDNKWTCGIFARDPDTGEAVWFYQFSPHDIFDWDSINEQILVDLPIDGSVRKVMLIAERNGYLYVIDRATGQVLRADPFFPSNVIRSVDLRTGRPTVVSAKVPRTGIVIRDVCPTAPGAKDWQPSSFSPRTRLMYIPHQNLCMDFEGVEANYISGTPYVGANVRMYAGPGGHRGQVQAWDPVRQKAAWIIKEDLPVWSGTAATAGDVVFYGTLDGWFKAVDAVNGRALWQFKTGSGIIGQPVVYRGPDGKQYVAILSGVGGWAGAIVAGDLDPADPTAGMGFVNAVRDLKDRTNKGGTLYVFALK